MKHLFVVQGLTVSRPDLQLMLQRVAPAFQKQSAAGCNEKALSNDGRQRKPSKWAGYPASIRPV